MRQSALWRLTTSRLLEFFREPAAIFWVYGFPLVLALILGVAFQDRPIEKLNVDVLSGGDKLLEILKSDPRIVVKAGDSIDDAKKRLMSGKTDFVIQPNDSSEPGEYLVWEERNRPESVLARSVVENLLNRAKLADEPTKLEEHNLQEVGKRYIDFLIPGLIGMNVMGGGLFGVGFVIVDMRVRKLLKRFLATPMKERDFLLSIMLSRLLFTIPEVSILFGFGWLFFGVGCKGSLFDLFAVICIGGFAFSGLGLLVASRAKTIETVSGLMNLAMLPQWAVSGVFFSSERFPESIQPIIQPLPLTAMNNALRGVINEGQGLTQLTHPLGILVAWGAISFIVALRIFRWR